MICNHWDIVAVPFPFMERNALKRRPALVISTKEFNAANDHTILAMITASILEKWPSDHLITKPKEAGLNHDCFVRMKVFTLPNVMISKIIGELSDEDREALIVKTRMTFIRA
jgi:mRNA interferase MazF